MSTDSDRKLEELLIRDDQVFAAQLRLNQLRRERAISSQDFRVARLKLQTIQDRIAVQIEMIDADSDFVVPRNYYVFSMGLNFVLGIVIIVWWMTRGYSENNYDVFDIYSNATIIFQWGLILVIGLLINRKLAQLFGKKA